MTKPDPTNAARQARFRENRAAQGITEVRGLYAPASLHAQIREAVRKLIEQSKQGDTK